MEPVRPMNQPTVNQTVQHDSHFSFSSPQGKKESVPVISDYYPKRIVYPYAKIDRRIDNRLVQAATVAQERAHAHSRSRCWHYVKDALLASGSSIPARRPTLPETLRPNSSTTTDSKDYR